MKHLLWVAVVVALVGCDAVASGPEVHTAPDAKAATATTSSVKVPFAQVNFVPCADDGAGELVSISGTLHILSHTTVDAQGGFHSTLRFHPQGASGVGQTTGDTYRANGGTSFYTNVNSGGLPFTDTFVNNFRLIGPGPGNNLQVHQNVHVTINENGELTAFVDNSSTSCK